ncbi:major intrinsically disordered Notch2-binding receptor 1 isoform X2 [Cyprinodon tularosa]|uniref:major intrinsically disordered Notch2-binding receptor 1 isoform X2 n=1 Tax=Cyprinodon tularosa TaxID=77115 RepID=UPI0018E26CD0|nr:major intrinsically disordered Notch2-binding receptor 1 isoform X2 [Cyprinodon tularosa]
MEVSLEQLLEELDIKQSMMTDQDVCQSLCARFDLASLAKIRRLLFSTACLDPTFPASLFKGRMLSCVEEEEQHSNKLIAAADIVTIFNLIQLNEELAPAKNPKGPKDKAPRLQSAEPFRSNTESSFKDGRRTNCDAKQRDARQHQHHHHHSKQQPQVQSGDSCSKLPASSTLDLHRSSDPNFLLRFTKDLECKEASLERHLPQLLGSSQASIRPERQNSFLPTEPPDEPDLRQLLGHPHSFTPHQMKEDWHQNLSFSSQVPTSECHQKSKTGDSCQRVYLRKPAPYFNHSFELSYSNPYMDPAFNYPMKDKLRVKHESLEDLQTSTYFGPMPALKHVTRSKNVTEAVKQPVWPLKSLSLNMQDDSDVSNKRSKQQKGNILYSISRSPNKNEQFFSNSKEKVIDSPNFTKKYNGIKTSDVSLVARCSAGKKLREKNWSGGSFQGTDVSSSVGTQTEQADPKTTTNYPSKFSCRDRQEPKHSEEKIISDDISDIFRFLDDMSTCDSLGVVQPSSQNSNGSLSQLTLKSEGDSSPEHGGGLDRSKLDRLLHLQENTDDELKLSVSKLVMRIAEIEKKLETLSGVRMEMSQVLSKLNKLDQNNQEPETNKKPGKNTGAVSGSTCDKSAPQHHPHSDGLLSAHLYSCHTIGHSMRAGSGEPGEGQSDKGNSDSLRIRALKRSLYAQRLSRSHVEESSATESKVASMSNSPRTLRAVSISCRHGDRNMDNDDSQDRHWKAKEAEQQQYYEVSRNPGEASLLSKPAKEPYLVEQIYSPRPFTLTSKAHTKDGSLYTDLKPSRPSHSKSSHPARIIQEYRCHPGEKRKPIFNPQSMDALNPNDLEYWMEDIHPAGYDALLRRKEAEFRRAKVCKIGALIAAATCTVILVVVVPICTMKS